jgi:hypothetical protein
MAVPTFSLRAGLNRRVGPVALQGAVRTGFGSVRALDGSLDDLWLVDAEIGVALMVR